MQLGSRGFQAVGDAAVGIGANMCLHAKIPVVSLLRARHLRVTLAGLVRGRGWRVDDRRIHQGAGAQRDAFAGKVAIDLGEDGLGQPMLIEQHGGSSGWWSHRRCDHRTVRSRLTGASRRYHKASPPPLDCATHTNSGGNRPAASFPAASAGARPSAQPSDNAVRSAPTIGSKEPPLPSLPGTARDASPSSSSHRSDREKRVALASAAL